jgi:hypothetical protein
MKEIAAKDVEPKFKLVQQSIDEFRKGYINIKTFLDEKQIEVFETAIKLITLFEKSEYVYYYIQLKQAQEQYGVIRSKIKLLKRLWTGYWTLRRIRGLLLNILKKNRQYTEAVLNGEVAQMGQFSNELNNLVAEVNKSLDASIQKAVSDLGITEIRNTLSQIENTYKQLYDVAGGVSTELDNAYRNLKTEMELKGTAIVEQ